MTLPPLATSTDFASLIGADTTGVDVDQLCIAASARVRAYCGWLIGPSMDETFTVNGSGTYRQFLPTMYLTALTSLTDAGVALDLTVLDWATEGYVEWTQGNPYLGTYPAYNFPGVFSVKPRGIVATVTHGYPAVPDEVQMVVCSMVARQVASPSGVVREQAGAVSAQYTQVAPNVSGGLSLLATEMATLSSYRIPRFR